MSKREFTLSDEQRAKLALALTHRSSTSTDHLSESALAALIEHKGQDEELNVWKHHLSECSECYRVFLECAQWRLAFAEEQAVHERQKMEQDRGWLAPLLGRWRFLVSSFASVFVVAVLFYLMPVNIPTPTAIQEQDDALILERSEQDLADDSTSVTKSRRKITPQKFSADRVQATAVPPASAELAKGASGTTAEPPTSTDAAISAQALILDRSAPEPVVTPKLQELVAKSEMSEAASVAAVAEEKAKKQSERRADEAMAQSNRAAASQARETQSRAPQAITPEQEHANNQASAERVEVTGSRIKADPMREEIVTLIDAEAFALGAQHVQTYSSKDSESQEIREPVPSSAKSETTGADKKRYRQSRLLGEWHYSAKTYCAQERSSRQSTELSSLVRRWPDLYKTLKLDTTQHSVWPSKINTVHMLCKVSEEISQILE